MRVRLTAELDPKAKRERPALKTGAAQEKALGQPLGMLQPNVPAAQESDIEQSEKHLGVWPAFDNQFLSILDLYF